MAWKQPMMDVTWWQRAGAEKAQKRRQDTIEGRGTATRISSCISWYKEGKTQTNSIRCSRKQIVSNIFTKSSFWTSDSVLSLFAFLLHEAFVVVALRVDFSSFCVALPAGADIFSIQYLAISKYGRLSRYALPLSPRSGWSPSCATVGYL